MKHFIAIALAFVTVTSVSAQEWAPVGTRIKTSWASEVSPANVHKEYPRPQMIRSSDSWQNLNGLWNYKVVRNGETRLDGKILVPFGIESSLSGVGVQFTPEDELVYNTTFKIQPKWSGKRVILHFEAVDWQASLSVNGNQVGTHKGGYTAFEYDVTPYLKKGRASQSLELRVKDGTDNGEQPRGKQVLDPHGIWYTPTSGIWQTVWLEVVDPAHVTDYYAVSDIKNGSIDLLVSAEGTQPGDVVKVSMHDGAVVSGDATPDKSRAVVASAEGKVGEHLTLKVADPKLWTPDTPYLYAMEISIERDGKTLDKVEAYTSLREISTVLDKIGRKRIALNGKPIFMMGPLDQGFWPDGIYTPPTDEAMKFDLIKLKELGFNMLRKHIKVEPSRYYYYCDQLGLLVWQDMPSMAYGNSTVNKWGRKGYEDGTDYPATATAKAEYYKEWGEIMNQLKKFQCIAVWVPFNEAWAQFDTPDAVKFTRELDPTRLVNASSGGNYSKKDGSDIIDIHYYPEPNAYFWDFDKINVIGEYGGIGLPVQGHLWQPDHNWGYIQYKDGHDVEKAYTEYSDKLCHLIDLGQSAGVYTQTTDCEIEVNGLMTYDRVLKVDPGVIRAANKKVIGRLSQSF